MSNPTRYCETCRQSRTFNGPLCITCGTAAETHAHVAYRPEQQVLQRARRKGQIKSGIGIATSTRTH